MKLKKILSVLLTALMLFNFAAVTPVMADGILEGNYTFIDTCYSPELGIYVAVAKDLDSTNTPSVIYVSSDAENWEKSKTFSSALHSANKANRQTIVWWESEKKFVASMNTKLYTSEDGYTWSEVTNELYNGSNTTVETNGSVLVLSSSAKIKFLNNFTDDPEVYSIDSNAYGKTIGITPEEPYRIAVTDQWKTWQVDAEGKVSSATPNLSSQPYEMEYVSGLGGWIVINGTPVLRTLSSEEVKYTNFTSMTLSNGNINEDNFTAVESNEDNIVVGTNKGKLYIAPNASSSVTIDTEWMIAQPGNIEENIEEIRSISAVNDGMFLVTSKTGIFMLIQTEEGWKYYDTSKSKMVLENNRIEIPVSGTLKETLTPVNYDYMGNISEDEIVNFEAVSDMPAGVVSENIGPASIEISVESAVKGGHELIYRATTMQGKTHDFTVTIVDEASIEIKGADEVVIPRKGEKAEKYEYLPTIVGTDGMDMSREIVFEVISMPEGILYNEENYTFTIGENSQPGTINLNIYSRYNPDNKIKKEIGVSLRSPKRAEFRTGESSVYIPDTGTESFQYTAMLFDKSGKEMPNDKLVWSVNSSDEGNSEISINSETGLMSVPSNSLMGSVTIKAASAENSNVYTEKVVELMYTDLRMAKEDLAEFKIDASVPITEDILFISTGSFESTITWKSSDEKLIGTDGKVKRPSRKDEAVTITGVAKKNSAQTETKYNLTVKKADNLCTNADFSEGTYDGWSPKNNTVLNIIQDNGKNVLRVTGEGAYQTLLFTNKSNYAFEAKVKAESGSKIKLVSQNGGTIAEITADGTYQDIKGSYGYVKQKDSFEDKIYLECDGVLMIDSIKIYEITLELDEVKKAVNSAVYSKKQSDIDNAKKLLDNFYDLPIRDEMYKELDKIEVSEKPSGGSGGRPGGGSSGGGGGGSSSGGTSTVPKDEPNYNDIATPTKPKDDYSDKVDTYLLKFKDMKNHWAREDVEYMGEKNIVTGDENGMFLPDDNISRAEFAALITRTMGMSETPYENSFFDVVSEDWYSGYVQTVRSNNFMNGYDGLFNPNQAITREEIAKVIVEAYNSKTNTKLEQGKSLYFNDLDSISYWAYDYVAEAAELGFINGVTDELFSPKTVATRAQATVMLRRVYDKLNPSGEASAVPTSSPSAES